MSFSIANTVIPSILFKQALPGPKPSACTVINYTASPINLSLVDFLGTEAISLQGSFGLPIVNMPSDAEMLLLFDTPIVGSMLTWKLFLSEQVNIIATQPASQIRDGDSINSLTIRIASLSPLVITVTVSFEGRTF